MRSDRVVTSELARLLNSLIDNFQTTQQLRVVVASDLVAVDKVTIQVI